MKVLHLTISGGLLGGGDTIISNILLEKIDGVEEQLATLFRSDFMEKVSLKSGVKYYHPNKNVRLIMPGRLWSVEIVVRNIPFILKLTKIIKKEKIDIVHAHGFPSAVAALILKLFCNIKIVYTHHFFRTKTSFLEKILLTSVYNNFDVNTGVSKTVCNSINLAFPGLKDKFVVVYNCVAREFFNIVNNSNISFIDQKNAGRKIFVQAARFHQIKNHIYIAKAIAKLEKAYQDKIFVVFLGEGEEKETVENYIKDNGLEDCFLFEGAISPNEVPDIMSACDYGLFPSELEGFGLGAVECMALGLPVIALDNELMREIVGDSGILVNKEDLDKAFIKMLSVGESLRQTARNQANTFSSSNMKNSYVNLYKKILAS